jgi:hypothetical protein
MTELFIDQEQKLHKRDYKAHGSNRNFSKCDWHLTEATEAPLVKKVARTLTEISCGNSSNFNKQDP